MIDSQYLVPLDGGHIGAPGICIDIINNVGAFVEVKRALETHQSLSIVRMSDGEAGILDYCLKHRPEELMTCWVTKEDPTWNDRYGVAGITCGEIQKRLTRAAIDCTYFAGDGWMPRCGCFLKFFPLRGPRGPLMNIGYHRQWTLGMKKELLGCAQKVIVINRDSKIADVIGNPAFTTATVKWISLSNWQESERVIEEATRPELEAYPLVLASLGPGSKYVVSEIAKRCPGKVALDIGSGAPKWWEDARF